MWHSASHRLLKLERSQRFVQFRKFRLEHRWVYSVYNVYNYGVLKMVVIWHLPTWHQCSNIYRLYPTLWHVAEATSGASSSTPNAGYVGGLRLPVSKTPQYYRIWFTHIRFLHGIWCETWAVDEHVLDMLRLVEIINDNSWRSAACWVYQRLSNWLRMDPGMRDMGYGHVWISVWSLFFLARLKILKTMTQSHPKLTLGQGYRQDWMAGQLRGSGV